MKTLGRLTLDTLTYYTAIAAAKQGSRRQRLQASTPFIQGRYGLYDDNATDLTQLAEVSLTTEQKEDLIHCYESPTGALNGLKQDIETHHNDNCPEVAALCQYCGLTYGPSDFDHYLPKELFPEFSVLSLNLVPCCGHCNGLKDTAWTDANGRRRIVSFYYDVLPDTRFLIADIEIGNIGNPVPSARFRLSGNTADYGGMMATITNHYEKLQLLGRYRRASPAVFSDKKLELAPVVEALGIAGARRILLEDAQNLSLTRSPNYWEVALLVGMAHSEDYLRTL
jgi:5-methylcytosine-specific restriction endonuclease McrA